MSFDYFCGPDDAEQYSFYRINTAFAPVLDANTDPADPIIGARSFSDDPEVVSAFGSKFMEGLHGEGVLTCVKHFPGH